MRMKFKLGRLGPGRATGLDTSIRVQDWRALKVKDALHEMHSEKAMQSESLLSRNGPRRRAVLGRPHIIRTKSHLAAHVPRLCV